MAATLPDETAGSAAEALRAAICACRACADLPLGPRPLVQIGAGARILIAGQAPGRRTHQAGRPFDDVSGARLRDWLGLDEATFRDPARVAILPMGFCYPGTGRSGDLPPRPMCAQLWRAQAVAALEAVRLTIVIGRFAQAWHLPGTTDQPLHAAVRDWQPRWPSTVLLPHPSPRNAGWIRRNPWFESELLPRVKGAVQVLLSGR